MGAPFQPECPVAFDVPEPVATVVPGVPQPFRRWPEYEKTAPGCRCCRLFGPGAAHGFLWHGAARAPRRGCGGARVLCHGPEGAPAPGPVAGKAAQEGKPSSILRR